MSTSEGSLPRQSSRKSRLWLFALGMLLGCGAAPEGSTGSQGARQNGTSEDDDSIFGNAAGDDEEEDSETDGDDQDDEGGTETPEDAPAEPSDDGEPVDVPDAPGEDCADEEARALIVLEAECASCHANGENDGGFGVALDPDAMIAQGFVVLGSLGGSELYEVSESGEMPLGAPNLSSDELNALADWILCEPGDAVPPVGGGGGAGDDDDDQEVDDDDDDADDDDDVDDAAEEAEEDQDDADEEAEEDQDDADEEAEEEADDD